MKQRILSTTISLFAAVSMSTTGAIILPSALLALKASLPNADPDDVAKFQLRGVQPQSFEQAIRDALAHDDPDLAASVLMLADAQKMPIGPDVREQAQMAQGLDLGRSLRDAWDGLEGGDAKSPEALAGAFTADMTGISDARDLVREGQAYLNNQPYSPLTMGLAAGGLVLTGVTVVSFGAATPARVGVTALRVADKADLLSPPMRRAMSSVAADLVDAKGIKETVGLVSAGDLSAARVALTRSVRAKPLATLTTAANDLGSVAMNNGYRTAHDILKVADSPADISRLRRLASGLGPRFRGALAVIGGAALTTATILASASGWIAAAAGWFLAALWMTYKLLRWGWRFSRWTFGKRPRISDVS